MVDIMVILLLVPVTGGVSR